MSDTTKVIFVPYITAKNRVVHHVLNQSIAITDHPVLGIHGTALCGQYCFFHIWNKYELDILERSTKRHGMNICKTCDRKNKTCRQSTEQS